ncbi:glycosyltransferase [Bacteroides sp. BFG-551]|nr:glycosyltransferase [Bacteroides sp. BFG-551]
MQGQNSVKISIITVTYNAVNHLEPTIKSVLSQLYDKIEYIIIDGASMDGTIDIIHKYESYINYWVSELDSGIYDAMNKGIHAATGDFIFFLNAGDLLYSEEVVKDIVDKIDNNNKIYYGNVYMRNQQGDVLYGGAFNKYKLTNRNICHQAVFYPTLILKNSNYNLKYKIFSDWEKNIFLYSKYKYIYINQIVSIYPLDGISAINSDYEFEKDLNAIIKRDLGILPFFYRKLACFKSLMVRMWSRKLF